MSAIPVLTITRWSVDGRARVTKVIPCSVDQADKMIAMFADKAYRVIRSATAVSIIHVSRRARAAWGI